jgi:hypothetical protein
VGGRNSGTYSASASRNYLVNGKQLVPKTPTADDGHWGRVEIVYSGNSTYSTFLNVIYVTDKGGASAATVDRISDAKGVEGGVFDGRIAGIFATARNGAQAKMSFTTSSSGDIDYYVSGLKAGPWRVNVNGENVGTYTATAEGGLLTFTAPAGRVEISMAK